jgi:hypothetical protein
MPTRTRRAFICQHASHDIPPRRFLGPDEPVPHCPDGHGRMVRQANVPYVRPDGSAGLETIGRRVEAPKRPATKRAPRRAKSKR